MDSDNNNGSILMDDNSNNNGGSRGSASNGERRRSTSDIPSQTASEFSENTDDPRDRLHSIREGEHNPDNNDDNDGQALEVVYKDPNDTPNHRHVRTVRGGSLSQSDRMPPRPNTLIREDSSVSSEYSRSAMKFLNVVKKVQMIKRIERVMRQQSAPTTPSRRVTGLSVPGGEVSDRSGLVDNGLGGGGCATETTPLKSSSVVMDGTVPLTPTGSSGDMGDDYLFSERPTILGYLKETICGKGVISLCLLAAPFAVWSVYQEWPATYVFWLNFAVMVPLAAILGDFTEELALHTNQTIGGLINATFGNAVEVVVAIQALLANEIRVVQSSMLGSIFSNLLLVLGGCFFFGGLKYKEQKFNSTAASANMALLALSGIALVLPTPFADYYELHDEHVLLVSRFAAIFLMFMYLQLLVFQLHTHAEIFEDGGAEENDELAQIPFWAALTGLLVATLLVTIFSDFLVDSIDGFVEASGISRTFVGIIILPIVGNAVEHVTAITVAMKNKMDLAMGVAVGSCTQISLFVVPLTVLVGWITDRDMNLNFPHFEVILFVMSVFTVSVVLSTPRCNWLEGSLLMTTYLLIAVGFWFEKVQKYDS